MTHSILVTGGAGYLGSILVPALLAAGHRVAVIDNFLWKQNSLASCCADPNFSVVNGDVRDEATMRRLVAGADVVIPLAALVGAPLCNKDPIAATTTNKDAIASMIAMMSPAQRILMPVTNSGYGVGEAGKFCTEETPLRPISRYGVDKVEAERMVLERENSISFRLATVFGMAPRMRLDLLVNDFVYRAVNDRFVVLFEAHFKRNYIHIRDVARAFLHGLDNFDAMRGRPYNVGLSDANLSKAELCAKIAAHVPGFVTMEAPVGEDPDKRDYIVSNARIEATGYRPAHSLDDGIRELVKGYAMIRNSLYSNV
ncbi:SDR family oxidoreductase [Arenibaculum sp.]|jgi:nucleoside-diphosphate-sugar epimerase|uniref:NAD-dependent epimerase/dehydratase family protein n=1 Tax=Arenibaculum sp. TaxID=2865862 RepID=UPI002E10580B|nr:SDR family oxidoreductase [Arenibaculum sp.]